MSTFDEMTPEERSQWRSLPATKAFFELVETAREVAKDRTIEAVYRCMPDAARAQSGVVRALEWLMTAVDRPTSQPLPVETEEFTDPATPPKRKWENR